MIGMRLDARDNSTFPVFLLHPVRQRRNTFTLVTLYTGAILPLDSTPEISILSLEHFYGADGVPPLGGAGQVRLDA